MGVIFKSIHDSLSLEVVTVGELQTNCCLLVDRDWHEGLLIDPGDEVERILAWVEPIDINSIVLTQTHFDHLAVVNDFIRV